MGGNGEAQFTMIHFILMVGASIGINVAVSVWLISEHRQNPHPSGVPMELFREDKAYREYLRDIVTRDIREMRERIRKLESLNREQGRTQDTHTITVK